MNQITGFCFKLIKLNWIPNTHVSLALIETRFRITAMSIGLNYVSMETNGFEGTCRRLGDNDASLTALRFVRLFKFWNLIARLLWAGCHCCSGDHAVSGGARVAILAAPCLIRQLVRLWHWRDRSPIDRGKPPWPSPSQEAEVIFVFGADCRGVTPSCLSCSFLFLFWQSWREQDWRRRGGGYCSCSGDHSVSGGARVGYIPFPPFPRASRASLFYCHYLSFDSIP